ncbi:hypothetical protein [Anaerococcus sp. Marseille-P3915]|uniref:hypothetical protein n=1 Tax=Anaerococcus sp. Marseille-P3915 TaxID=2057799 RepID=UPI000D0B7BBF|nr:hypothetical protein [Anaerococcus sp. Marseille-P3915]
MRKVSMIGTSFFIIYLITIFCLFYNYDKKLLAVFSSIGSAVYVIFVKKYIDYEKNEKSSRNL